ncbi:hypothetical protein [Desulfonatronovibrio magnus]|uniref:hypothetical protein n=1 Tax=Desulfonatronovibrio magnus TaxID=698827 RepID=UPI0005EAED17|nr:hypothetical protein [Desulfonatronovibrio magnus]RQD65378.1 MAG: hypothetical protein D5R98_03680 [Desulfonatronovibrio sp. MSAO_Bac4]
MKIVFILSLALSLITSFSLANATEIDALREQMAEIEIEMREISRSSTSLIDRQATRLMNMEEEIQNVRQQILRELAEVERVLSQEQTLLREYLDIINQKNESLESSISGHRQEISSIQSSLNELEETLERLSSSLTDQQQELRNTLHEMFSQDFKTFETELGSVSEQLPAIIETLNLHQSKLDELSNHDDLESRLQSFSREIEDTDAKVSQLSTMLNQIVEEQINTIRSLENNLQAQLEELEDQIIFTDQGVMESVQRTEAIILEIEKYLGTREVQVAGALSAAFFLALFGIVFGLTSRRKLSRVHHQIMDDQQKLRRQMDDQGAILDTKMVELLEKQIPLLPGTETDNTSTETVHHQEQDHTLAIVMGEEIFQIMKRKKMYAEDSEAFDKLKVSLRRMWSTFKQKGYEIVDLMDKPYSEDMDINAEFTLTHELLPGEQIISKIRSPWIRYNGQTIQQGEVEVLVGD